MAVINCDLDDNDEVVLAIQLIVNVITYTRTKLADVQGERDSLLALIKNLETERLSDDLLTTDMDENRRKRIKTEFNTSSQSQTNNSTSNDLNAAFNSSMISSMYEDDVVEPTQIFLNESIKDPRELNKENCNGIKMMHHSRSINAKERSPTVLSKCYMKKANNETYKNNAPPLHVVDVNEISLANQSKSVSKVDETHKLSFKSSSKMSTAQHSCESTFSDVLFAQPKTNIRKKLSLGVSESSLLQSTNYSPECADETYCEGHIINENKNQSNDIERKICIKMNEEKQLESKMKQTNTTGDSVILLDKVTEKKNQKTKSDCEECEKYYTLLGRNMNRNSQDKDGVCAKHHRKAIRCNIQYNTPPGFWNPKIDDSDSNED